MYLAYALWWSWKKCNGLKKSKKWLEKVMKRRKALSLVALKSGFLINNPFYKYLKVTF